MVIVLKTFAHDQPSDPGVIAGIIRGLEVTGSTGVSKGIDQPPLNRVAHQAEEVPSTQRASRRELDQAADGKVDRQGQPEFPGIEPMHRKVEVVDMLGVIRVVSMQANEDSLIGFVLRPKTPRIPEFRGLWDPVCIGMA